MRTFIVWIALMSSMRGQGSARELALSTASTSSVTVHPECGIASSLAWVSGVTASISVMPQRYEIPGLNASEVSIAGRLFGLGSALGVTMLEGGPARSLSMRTAIGMLIGDAGIGGAIALHHWSFTGYASHNEVELSSSAELRAEQFRTAVEVSSSILNERAPGFGDVRLKVGWLLPVGDASGISCEVRADPGWPLSYRYGCEAVLSDVVTMLASWSDDPQVLAGGISVDGSGWGMTWGAQWHAQLGWSSGVDLRVKVAQ